MICYSLVVLSVLLFFYGFFPVSKPSEGFRNEPPRYVSNVSLPKDIYKPQVSKLVLIVIDALRIDFISSKLMPQTTKIVRETGCFNNVTVETPTVTMPRLKALTAGNLPQFIDIVMNLASTEILKDSLIHSAYWNNYKIIFYGDDTWLKLFPSYFMRYEGTTSFFVRDFTEVDDNVTKNVMLELDNDDWNIMILHYLGLDHIGHVHGPFTSLVPGKLKEMDQVIHKIYTSLSEKDNNVLIVVTGDHGMKDSGGHGGSTYAETNVPLMVLGRTCRNSSLSQTDISINLAVLLGVDIPSAAVGLIHNDLLQFSLHKYLYVLYYNMLSLKHKSMLCDSEFREATRLHSIYISHKDEALGMKAAELYQQCSVMICNELSKAAVNQDVILLFGSLFLMACTLVYMFKKIKMIILGNCRGHVTYILLFTCIHPLIFISSSYLEEEHEFWYFASSFLFLTYVLMLYKEKRLNRMTYCFTLIALIRYVRILNSTGDKWAGYPDFSDWLMKEENYLYHQIVFVLSLVVLALTQCLTCINTSTTKVSMDSLILSLIFFYKLTEKNIALGRMIWCLLLLYMFLFHRSSKVEWWTHICALLLKQYNVILLPVCLLLCTFFHSSSNKLLIILSHVWIGNMLYFAQGHSNSLASVDISVGYVGLEDYSPLFVIPQVLCHIYAFPVLCHMLIFRAISEKHCKSTVWDVLFLNRLYVTLIVSLNTLFFRGHLFIWSVFAPKLFIECVHTVFFFMEYILYVLYQSLTRKRGNKKYL